MCGTYSPVFHVTKVPPAGFFALAGTVAVNVSTWPTLNAAE
jgi:hypothetical protein